jgi:hypothetical protein
VTDDRAVICRHCGEPGVTVEAACYDCAVVCRSCGVNPADPDTGICPNCQRGAPAPPNPADPYANQ